MPLKLPRLSTLIDIVPGLKAALPLTRFWDQAMSNIEGAEAIQTETIERIDGILAGSVPFTELNVNGDTVTDLVETAADIGLGNVENKSSADIRSELTSANVTDALTYTPVNKAGDTMTGALQVTQLNVSGTKVVGAQGAAVADAAGGATIDAEARTALNALLARLRTHGLIAT